MKKSYYFFVYYPRNEKEKEIKFVEPEEKAQKPECIYSLEDLENGIFYYKKIFKATPKKSKSKKSTSCHYVFEIGEEQYNINFKKNNTFVFDVDIEFGKSAIDTRRKIEQTNIKYIDKLDYFIEALTEKGEEDKIDELFKDALTLYANIKQFSFLISLFLKIYKKKELCSDLIEKFKEMNCDPKQNEKNIDRKDYLKNYTSKFIEIIQEADKLVTDNNYNPIAFFGVVLCYLNFYDINSFNSLVDKLAEKRPKDLYEILLIYNKHLINPIKQNFDFLNKFISYDIKNKKFDTFKIGLNYIKDIETFISIITKNKEDIFETYITEETLNLRKQLKELNNENRDLHKKINEQSLEIKDLKEEYKSKIETIFLEINTLKENIQIRKNNYDNAPPLIIHKHPFPSKTVKSLDNIDSTKEKTDGKYITSISFFLNNYIDICIEKLNYYGYKEVEGDIRKGAGDLYCVIGCKYEKNQPYITNIIGSVSDDKQPISIYENGIKYIAVKDPFNNFDIHKGSGGNYLSLYYTIDPKAGKPIKNIKTLHTEEFLNSPNLVKYSNRNTEYNKPFQALDCNRGRGGSTPQNYLVIERDE